MFSPNELENYQQIKASDDLKEQIIKNVDRTHKRNKKIAIRLAAATACLMLCVFANKMYLLRNHVLSIDGVPVLYNSRTVQETIPYSVANSNEENLQICIPLEIRIYEEARITVSDGTLSTNEHNQESEISINNPNDVLWYISRKDAENAQCNIVTKNKKYTYELFYDEKTNNYSIRQIKNN